MTLIIQKPTGAKLNLAQTYVGLDDPDAAVYIAAVEAADEAASPGVGALETATKVAIHSFVKGCKADGIWPAIKASCILAGARTLEGALVPLVGAAPTNFNFVSGDYNRETGLVGVTANSTRLTVSVTVSTLNSFHGAIYKTENETVDNPLFSNSNTNNATTRLTPAVSSFGYRLFGGGNNAFSIANRLTGFIGMTNPAYRHPGATGALTSIGAATFATTTFSVLSGVNSLPSDARIAFYSFGDNLDLALLDARVTTLINAFAAAIP
jgi:hypothetical protein